MRRPICAFVVRIWHKTHFLMARLMYVWRLLKHNTLKSLFSCDGSYPVLGETASRAELISMEKSKGQGQLKITTPQAAPPNIIITKPEILLHRQVSEASSQGRQGSMSPQVMTTVSMVTKTVSIATSSQGGSTVTVASSTQPGTNPLMARLVQQMGAGQMLSVSDLLAAQRLQGQQTKTTTAFKIQGNTSG